MIQYFEEKHNISIQTVKMWHDQQKDNDKDKHKHPKTITMTNTFREHLQGFENFEDI